MDLDEQTAPPDQNSSNVGTPATATPPANPSDNPPASKPRRPHHKSRTGCQNCKVRKVKCDENKPICNKCKSHGAKCSYLMTHPLKRGLPTIESMLASPTTASHPSSAPSSNAHTPIPDRYSPAPAPLPTPSPHLSTSFNMLDMELLHFWTTTSVEEFIDCRESVELFRTTVVQLAFEHEFLMHEILALSALHLARLRPSNAEHYVRTSDSHVAKALALFQPQVASLTPQNCHACFAFSTTLFVHAWASQDVRKPSALFFKPSESSTPPDESHQIQWVKLHRGAQSISRAIYPVLASGPLAMVFAPWKSLKDDRPDPLLGSEARLFDDLAEAWHTSPRCTTEDKAILDVALSKLKRVFSMLTYNLNIPKLNIVMAWFPMISEEYLKMMEKKIPEALLLVLYYCVALKRLEHLWWVRGKAENLLNTVNIELGPGWGRWTRWPVEQVLGVQAGIGSGGIMGFGSIMNSV